VNRICMGGSHTYAAFLWVLSRYRSSAACFWWWGLTYTYQWKQGDQNNSHGKNDGGAQLSNENSTQTEKCTASRLKQESNNAQEQSASSNMMQKFTHLLVSIKKREQRWVNVIWMVLYTYLSATSNIRVKGKALLLQPPKLALVPLPYPSSSLSDFSTSSSHFI
jgi:hypothetical protein